MLVRLICAGNAVARLIPWHGLKLRSKKSTENRAFASGGDMRGYYLAVTSRRRLGTVGFDHL